MAKVIENGRFTSVAVEHVGTLFNIWRFDRAQREYEVFCNQRGGISITFSNDDAEVSCYEDWLKKAAFHRHIFRREQVIEAVFQALSDAEATHADDAQYGPYGFERSDISQLLAKVKRLR